MLPKHWGEPVGGGEVGEQLAAKQLSHNSLLLTLSQAGILQQLPPPVLRCLTPPLLDAAVRQSQCLISPLPRRSSVAGCLLSTSAAGRMQHLSAMHYHRKARCGPRQLPLQMQVKGMPSSRTSRGRIA